MQPELPPRNLLKKWRQELVADIEEQLVTLSWLDAHLGIEPEQGKIAESESEAPAEAGRVRRSPAEREAALRDWARGQGWFTRRAAHEALGYRDKESLSVTFASLLDRGTLETNGRASRARRYRFAQPERAQLRSVDANGAGYGGSNQGAVAGTGRQRISTTDKDYAAVVRSAQTRGWSVEASSGGKDSLVHTSGAKISLAKTPSDNRAAANLDATLRRMEA